MLKYCWLFVTFTLLLAIETSDSANVYTYQFNNRSESSSNTIDHSDRPQFYFEESYFQKSSNPHSYLQTSVNNNENEKLQDQSTNNNIDSRIISKSEVTQPQLNRQTENVVNNRYSESRADGSSGVKYKIITSFKTFPRNDPFAYDSLQERGAVISNFEKNANTLSKEFKESSINSGKNSTNNQETNSSLQSYYTVFAETDKKKEENTFSTSTNSFNDMNRKIQDTKFDNEIKIKVVISPSNDTQLKTKSLFDELEELKASNSEANISSIWLSNDTDLSLLAYHFYNNEKSKRIETTSGILYINECTNHYFHTKSF